MTKGQTVVVPREPTEAMIAAAERLYDFPLGSSTAINSPAPDAIWSAMLSAAPPPSVGERVREADVNELRVVCVALAGRGDHYRINEDDDLTLGVLRRILAAIKSEPAPSVGEGVRERVAATGARAVIRDGQIVISVDVDALPMIVSGSCASGDNYLQGLWRVTDAEAFAQEVCHALNNEQENGTTPVHIMFDRAFNNAIGQGAEGVEEVSEEEFEAESARLQAEALAALRPDAGGA